MGKTLVIKGADFSEVSIGHIDLPRELSDATLEFINASGNTFTVEQQNAIDDFVLALGIGEEGGIYSKLDFIFLPILAADKAHALVDYKTLTSPTLTGGSLTSWETYISLRNHGLVSSLDTGTKTPIVVTEQYSIDTQDCCMFVMNTEDYSTISTTSKTRSGFGSNNSTTYKRFLKTQTQSAMQFYIFSNSPAAYDTSSSYRVAAATGFNSANTGCRIYKPTGSTDISAITQETITGGISLMTQATNYLQYDTDASQGAYIIGKVLSNEQADTLVAKLNALLSAILSE